MQILGTTLWLVRYIHIFTATCTHKYTHTQTYKQTNDVLTIWVFQCCQMQALLSTKIIHEIQSQVQGGRWPELAQRWWELSRFDASRAWSRFAVALYEAVAQLDAPAKMDAAFVEFHTAVTRDRRLPLNGVLRAWLARLAGTILLVMDRKERWDFSNIFVLSDVQSIPLQHV